MDPVIHYYRIRESINVKNNNYLVVIISVTIILALNYAQYAYIYVMPLQKFVM